MRIKSFIASLLGAALIAVPAVATGMNGVSGKGGHDDRAGTATTNTPFGRPGEPKKVTRVVQITATEIDFNIHDLTFTKGQTVKFVLVNRGEQEHELMIGDEATQEEHRKMMTDMSGIGHEEMEAKMGGHADEGNAIDTKPGETRNSSGSSRSLALSNSPAIIPATPSSACRARSRSDSGFCALQGAHGARRARRAGFSRSGHSPQCSRRREGGYNSGRNLGPGRRTFPRVGIQANRPAACASSS